ncbi:MAG: hypothetical protein IT435_02560 [Phycisphaerales bacterium]|nr:hypothetical protein [Phycisphaerales bacterium]
MNQTVLGVLGTLATLGTIGALAPDRQPAAAPPQAAAPVLTPQQQEALRQAFNAPPGSTVEVEISNKDGGTVKTRNEGRGVGAGAVAEGDKLDQKFDGSPPRVGLGADGSQTAEGGGSDSEQKASALKIPPLPWQNPMFWLGLVCLGGSAFCFYRLLRRPAVILAASGVGLLAAAFYPVILLYTAAAVLLMIVGPYIWAEFQKKKHEGESNSKREALRAVVAGVEHRDVPPEMQRVVKAAIAKEADGSDKAVIDEVKRDDKVGKYAD